MQGSQHVSQSFHSSLSSRFNKNFPQPFLLHKNPENSGFHFKQPSSCSTFSALLSHLLGKLSTGKRFRLFALAPKVCFKLNQQPNINSKAGWFVAKVFTLDQAAEQLAISKRTLQRLITAGRIEAIHVSKSCVRIRETAIERYLNQLERQQRLGASNHE